MILYSRPPLALYSFIQMIGASKDYRQEPVCWKPEHSTTNLRDSEQKETDKSGHRSESDALLIRLAWNWYNMHMVTWAIEPAAIS